MRFLESNPRIQSTAVWGLFVLIVGWLFWPGIFSQQIPAFRDGYHFYWPQAIWLNQQFQLGNYFPSWNPDECWGVSVVGQPSSGLFYPLRVIWLCSIAPLATRYSLFMAMHVILSAVGMRLACKRFSHCEQTANLAGVCYGLSAAVLCQHFNLIYLCSASWIGFAIAGLHSLLETRTSAAGLQVGSYLWLPFACIMMFLGGDPHTCYNALLLAFASVCYRSFTLSLRPLPGNNGAGRVHTVRVLIGRTVIALTLTGCLTAVQWLPAWQWSRQSTRLSSGSTTVIDPNLSLGMQAAINRDATKSSVDYGFSVAPWHFVTCAAPNLGGHYVPQNTRWFDVLAAEPRMWIPSLYFGILPFVGFALCLFRRLLARGSKAHHEGLFTMRWLLALALISALLSMGHYSIGWLVQQILSLLGADANQFASWSNLNPYYLLTWFPGYSGFRYPSKWNVWFVAASSLVAALSWREFTKLNKQAGANPKRHLLTFALLMIAAGVTTFVISQFDFSVVRFQLALNRYAVDHWLGVPNAKACLNIITVSLLIPGIILLIWHQLEKHILTITLLTLVDLTIAANAWMVFSDQPDLNLARPLAGEKANVWIDQTENRHPQKAGNDLELPSYAEAQQNFLLGKLGASLNLGRAHASQSIQAGAQSRLKRWLTQKDNFAVAQPKLDDQLKQLGITHRLARAADGRLKFVKIQNARPMCELQSLESSGRNPATDDVGEIDWKWFNSDQLDLYIRSETSAILLIRQFNDGGWILKNENSEQSISPDSGKFFLYFTIDAGEESWRLLRQ